MIKNRIIKKKVNILNYSFNVLNRAFNILALFFLLCNLSFSQLRELETNCLWIVRESMYNKTMISNAINYADSVGLITARSGLIVSGVTTFSNDVDFKGSGGSTKILFDASQDQLEFADSATLTFGDHPTTGDYQINYVNGGDFAINAMSGGSQDLVIGRYESATQKKHLVSTRAGVIELYHDNSKKLETNSTGVNVTGAITVNGSALSITPTDSDIQVVYTVTANGASAYRFAGNGVVSTADNPDLYFIRGQKYRFINNSGGSHPFQIREASGGTAYSTGVTNNGAASGNIDFAPTYDSPAQLVYQCTSHGGMVGNIYLRDAAGGNTNVGVTTITGGLLHIKNDTSPAIRLQDNNNANSDFKIYSPDGDNHLRIYHENTSTDLFTLTSAGNFGLATTSPVAQTTSGSVALTPVLDLKGTGSLANASGVLQFTRKDNATQGSCIYSAGEDAGLTFRNTDGNGFGFYNGTSLSARIFSTGQVGINRDTTPLNGVKLMVQNGSNNVFYAYHEGTGNNYTFLCRNDRAVSSTQATQIIFLGSGNTFVGDIRSTGSSTSYNTSSDYRLKENVTTISDGITRLKTLKPSRFNFISNPSQTVDGFLAHEVTAVPEAISGTKDEVVTQAMIDNGDAPSDSKLNDPIYQQIDQAKLVPLLTAALQEAVAKIETLESKVATLEGS